ncbi:MAG: FAD/NAD(P)-binding protein [Coprothermobacterota bacterium]|nr:FAD/NAD(P)-binding protein [Coprothermobacterota bacterium]
MPPAPANPYLPVPVRVESAVFESEDRSLKTLSLSFLDPSGRFDFLPGQFVEFSVPGKGESPFGIASSPTEELLRVTVNKAGTVTRAIHNLDRGDRVGLRGPFGNWYPIDLFRGANLAIISGGFAFTTLASLLDYVLEKHSDEVGRIDLIYGARTPGMLLYKEKLTAWQANPRLRCWITVDRETPGWQGLVGFVPDVVARAEISPDNTYAVVCGPPIMIKLTLPRLLEKGFPRDRIYTSLERRMKCGIGKCGRCNIGPKYVCKDGPVFSYAELEGLPEEY